MMKTLITAAVLVILVAGGFVGWTYLTYNTPLPCAAASIKVADEGGEPFEFGDDGIGGNVFLCSYYLVTGDDRMLRDDGGRNGGGRVNGGGNGGQGGNGGNNNTSY